MMLLLLWVEGCNVLSFTLMDSADHPLLLKNVGFDHKAIAWFRNGLSERGQRVVLGS